MLVSGSTTLSGLSTFQGGTLGDGAATNGYVLASLSQTINDETTNSDSATYTMLKANLTVVVY